MWIRDRWTYLADLNEQAQERLDTIMEQMKIAEGVTEELKCTRQMEWVRRCNNIHNRAEEIIDVYKRQGSPSPPVWEKPYIIFLCGFFPIQKKA